MLIRSKPPKLFFNSQINELGYEIISLGNSTPLYYIEDNSQEVCGLEIVFSGGKISESVNGASYFATTLLKSGIEGKDANEINEFFELRGAFVQVQSGLDFNSLSLYCLSHQLEETLPFFLKLFTHPSFPGNQLNKLITKKKQELEINDQKSNYWSSKILKKALYNDHPYGHSINFDDLDSITRDDLEDHWKNKYLNGIQFITVVGKFDLRKISDELDLRLELKKTQESELIKKIDFNHNPLLKVKKLKDNQQSSLRIGLHTINLKNNKYPSLSIANTILGGYFGSRLMQSIREDKGLTYGINSSIIHLAQSSYLQISADIKIGVGQQVTDLIKLELHKLATKRINNAELNKVRSYLIGEYKSSSETIFDKISKVKFLKLQNLPDSYFIDHFRLILELTPEQIQESLVNFVKPDLFKTVIIE